VGITFTANQSYMYLVKSFELTLLKQVNLHNRKKINILKIKLPLKSKYKIIWQIIHEAITEIFK
jgi:hypothetical protein